MFMLNITMANITRNMLLGDAIYNDKIELIKRMYPWSWLMQQSSVYTNRMLSNEQFVADFLKFSCDSGCSTDESCIKTYPELSDVLPPNGMAVFKYDQTYCNIGKYYEPCARDGYYDYFEHDHSRGWANLDKEHANDLIYDMIVLTATTFAGLFESCIAKGDCQYNYEMDFYENGLYGIPKSQQIAEFLAQTVCDTSCIITPCIDQQGACIPDHCGIIRDGYKFGAIYDQYVCKATKSYLGCDKEPPSKDDKEGIIIMCVVIAVVIIITASITYCITAKCKSQIKLDMSSYDSSSSEDSKSSTNKHEEV
jgi:hypothetical protein